MTMPSMKALSPPRGPDWLSVTALRRPCVMIIQPCSGGDMSSIVISEGDGAVCVGVVFWGMSIPGISGLDWDWDWDWAWAPGETPSSKSAAGGGCQSQRHRSLLKNRREGGGPLRFGLFRRRGIGGGRHADEIVNRNRRQFDENEGPLGKNGAGRDGHCHGYGATWHRAVVMGRDLFCRRVRHRHVVAGGMAHAGGMGGSDGGENQPRTRQP